ILAEIRARYPGLESGRAVHELVRRLITRMINDVIAESGRRLAAAAPGSADDVRLAGAPMVGFSPDMEVADRAIKAFLFVGMYRHSRIARVMGDAERVVRDLFDHYTRIPADLPPEWHAEGGAGDAGDRARLVADYIAGMTDRYALIEHGRFFDSTPDLR